MPKYYPNTTTTNYPFGMLIKERSYSSDSYRFGFGGQEKDKEINSVGNIYTAQFWEYDSRLGRRWNVDPVKQIHISDYAVFNNSPLILVDIKGDKVDLSRFMNKDKQNDTKKEQETGKPINYTESLKADLEEKTGLTLDINNETGMLTYKTGPDGKAIVKEGVGSEIARNDLMSLIDIERITEVDMINDKTDLAQYGIMDNKTSKTSLGGYDADFILLNIDDINRNIDNTFSGLDVETLNKTTMGFAMTFLHESYHSRGRYSDKMEPDYPSGKTAAQMNNIRRQLGPDYGIRLNYVPIYGEYTRFGKQNTILGVHPINPFPCLGWHVKNIK
jgi:RHS repeat-associated protein